MNAFLVGGISIPIAVPAETQKFLTFGPHSTSFESAEGLRQILMPVSGTLKNFFVQTASPQPSDAPLTLGVRVNGVDTGILITILADAPAGTYSDVENDGSFVAGDLVSFRCANFSELGASATLRLWSIAAAETPESE